MALLAPSGIMNRRGFRSAPVVAVPPPAGIPVASTNTINVVDTFGYNGTIALSKLNSTLYSASVSFIYGTAFCEAYSDNVNVYIGAIRLTKESGYWIYRYEGIYECGGDNFGQNYDISSVQEVTSGIIPTTGWPPSLTIAADTFPLSITVAGTFGFANSAPNTLYPITNLDQRSYDNEIASLADKSIPYRIYLSTAINNEEYQTFDYKYVIYLDPSNFNGTSGYYAEFISSGRWLFGCGNTFSGDNSGYSVNFGYYTAPQSKNTPPSSNVANWTRIAGYYPNSGTLTGITFNY